MVPRSESLSSLPYVLRSILSERGIEGEEALEKYFFSSIEDLAKPEELPGVTTAAEVILESVKAGDDIIVFGDYDCDGVSATAILVRALRALEAKVEPFLPDRLSEGYGMSDASVQRMLKLNPTAKLVITVDNGVNSIPQTKELKSKGIKVVITDHHLPGDDIEELKSAADALVDPKVDTTEDHPLNGLCGAGVAFMLANRIISEAKLCGMYNGESIAGPLLILAGLATITDIMLLTPQNRLLVSIALRQFRNLAPIGLKELYSRAAKTGSDRMVTKDFSFLLGPRINASGRIGSGMDALELALTDDREIARELARMVDDCNRGRKEIEQKMTEEALSKIVPGAPAQVIDLPTGHKGVAGIVAARILEKLRTPTFVIASGHGSARAEDGINVRDVMERCKDILDSYGGHAAAGGFTVQPEKIDEFRNRICELCAQLTVTSNPNEASSECVVDAWVETKTLTLDFAEWVKMMEPFGDGNPEPVFGVRGLFFSDIKALGADGRHLSLNFRDRNCPRAVWWNHGELVEKLRADSVRPHDIRFTVEISEYGARHIELRIVGID